MFKMSKNEIWEVELFLIKSALLLIFADRLKKKMK